jgi:hypothetical protein
MWSMHGMKLVASRAIAIILLAAFVFIVVYTVTGARGRGNAGGMIH